MNLSQYVTKAGDLMTFHSRELEMIGNEELCKKLGYTTLEELKNAQAAENLKILQETKERLRRSQAHVTHNRISEYNDVVFNRILALLHEEQNEDAEEDFPPLRNN